MKIQKMKSGISHLKRMEMERRTDLFELQAAGQPLAEPVTAPSLPATSDLDEPRWAVVSFDQMEAGGLTYSQAYALMSELESQVAGLCIVTDEAARRISP